MSLLQPLGVCKLFTKQWASVLCGLPLVSSLRLQLLHNFYAECLQMKLAETIHPLCPKWKDFFPRVLLLCNSAEVSTPSPCRRAFLSFKLKFVYAAASLVALTAVGLGNLALFPAQQFSNCWACSLMLTLIGQIGNMRKRWDLATFKISLQRQSGFAPLLYKTCILDRCLQHRDSHKTFLVLL